MPLEHLEEKLTITRYCNLKELKEKQVCELSCGSNEKFFQLIHSTWHISVLFVESTDGIVDLLTLQQTNHATDIFLETGFESLTAEASEEFERGTEFPRNWNLFEYRPVGLANRVCLAEFHAWSKLDEEVVRNREFQKTFLQELGVWFQIFIQLKESDFRYIKFTLRIEVDNNRRKSYFIKRTQILYLNLLYSRTEYPSSWLIFRLLDEW